MPVSMPSRSPVVVVPGVPPTPLSNAHQGNATAPSQAGQTRLRPNTTHLVGLNRGEKPVRSYVAATQAPPPPPPPQVPKKVPSDNQQPTVSTKPPTIPESSVKQAKKIPDVSKAESLPKEIETKAPVDEKVAAPEVSGSTETEQKQEPLKPRSTWAQRARAAKDVQPESVPSPTPLAKKTPNAIAPKAPQTKSGPSGREDKPHEHDTQTPALSELQSGRGKGKTTKRPASRKKDPIEKSQRSPLADKTSQQSEVRKIDSASSQSKDDVELNLPKPTPDSSTKHDESTDMKPTNGNILIHASTDTPLDDGIEKKKEAAAAIKTSPDVVVNNPNETIPKKTDPIQGAKNNEATKPIVKEIPAEPVTESNADNKGDGTATAADDKDTVTQQAEPEEEVAKHPVVAPITETDASRQSATGLPVCNVGPRVGLSSKFASKDGGRIGSILDRFQGQRLQSLDKPTKRESVPELDQIAQSSPKPPPVSDTTYSYDLVPTKTGRKRYRMEDMLMIRHAPHCQMLRNRQDLPDWILSRRRGRPSSSEGVNGVNETMKVSGDGGRFGASSASHSGMLRKGFSTDFAASESTWSSGGAKPRLFGDKHHGGGGGGSGYGRSNTYAADKEEWQRGSHHKGGPPPPLPGSYEIPELPEESWQVQQEKQKKTDADRGVKLMRRLRAQLNKMTPTTYNDIFEAIVEIGIETTDEAQEFVNLIFEKAITNHQYIDMYAELCGMLKSVLEGRGIFSVKGEKEEFNFRRMLLLCCQKAFEKNLENDFVAPPDLNREEAFELLLIHKEKMKGNLMFVGCLAQNDLVPNAVLMMIMRNLIESGKSLQLEALASFLPTVFETLDASSRYSSSFNQFFEQVYAVSQDSSVDHRVQCLLKDVVEKFEAIQQKKMEENNAVNKSGSQRQSFAAVLGVRKNKLKWLSNYSETVSANQIHLD